MERHVTSCPFLNFSHLSISHIFCQRKFVAPVYGIYLILTGTNSYTGKRMPYDPLRHHRRSIRLRRFPLKAVSNLASPFADLYRRSYVRSNPQPPTEFARKVAQRLPGNRGFTTISSAMNTISSASGNISVITPYVGQRTAGRALIVLELDGRDPDERHRA